ncbi:MAG: peptidylprolyl isomerase [Polaromonas sp.]|jgi:peptidyl-prolyl cis-trans isomerase C|nr:peptidylprolyl isomerase [Polaromonas sp.]MBP8088164.1 peptidylprolyl isomerase [Polaromonas sp.]
MKKQVLIATALASLLSLGTSAALAQNVAIVNGKAVPKARMEALSQQFQSTGRPVTPEVQDQMRQHLIALEVFSQEADKLGLSSSDDFKAQMELARQNVLANQLIKDFEKKNAITDELLKAEYDKFAAANGGKEIKARHILVEKEADAVAIIASLKKGGKFEDIAKKRSKDTGSGAKGGDLDWANPTSYVPEFSAALLKLNKGQLTDKPVKTQFGFHIIRVDDTRDIKLPSFDEVKPQIADQMKQDKRGNFQRDLLGKAKVE